MIKTLRLRTEGNGINLIKGTYKKYTASTIFYGEKLNTSILISGTRQGVPVSLLLFKTILEVLNKQSGKKME